MVNLILKCSEMVYPLNYNNPKVQSYMQHMKPLFSLFHAPIIVYPPAMLTILTTLHSKYIHASLALPCLAAACGSDTAPAASRVMRSW